jgi:hypothetical protein
MELPTKKDYLTSNQTSIPSTKSGHTDYNLGPDEFGVYDDAATYYNSEARHGGRNHNRSRTYSQVSLVCLFDSLRRQHFPDNDGSTRMASLSRWSV